MDGRAHGDAVEADQPDARATGGAGHRLGVKAAVGRAFVLGPTVGAHGKGGHGGGGAVVGDAAQDAQPWPAMGAVGEGIAVAAGRGIGDLGGTGGAKGGVGRNLGMRRAGEAVGDVEAFGEHARIGATIDALDPGERRRLAAKRRDEGIDGGSAAGGPHQHAITIVQDLAAQAELPGRPPDGRPKAHALHAAADAYLDAVGRGGHGGALRDAEGSKPSCSTRLASISACVDSRPLALSRRSQYGGVFRRLSKGSRQDRAAWMKWRPLGDSNPCFRRERATSWTARRRGPSGAGRYVAAGRRRIKPVQRGAVRRKRATSSTSAEKRNWSMGRSSARRQPRAARRAASRAKLPGWQEA